MKNDLARTAYTTFDQVQYLVSLVLRTAFYCRIDVVLHASQRSATNKTDAQAPSSHSCSGGNEDNLKLIAPQTTKPTESYHKTI
jgi:hypothetical protein